MKNNFKNKGIATLPVIIVIGTMALAIVVSITYVSLSELNISHNASQSSMALYYAESGARDALIKIARNKNYTCSSTDCYSIDFNPNGCINGIDCAKVSVSGLGTTADPKIIISKGIMRTNIRKIQVSVILDGGTIDNLLKYGEITSTVWTELIN